MTDWIKHECDEALIEINIFKNETETVVFSRQFNQAGLDEFKIDGKKYTRKQFLIKVKEFNIQVDNLCQFLPQDRVQDFAKMNAQELLLNTQVSVCTEEVHNQFQQLLDLRAKQLDVGKDEKVRQKEVEDLQAKNEGLRPQIENIQARGNLTKDLDMTNRKLAWMESEKLATKVGEYQTDLDQAQRKLSVAEQQLDPVKKKAASIIAEKKQMEAKIETEREVAKKLQLTIAKQRDQLSRFSQEIQNAKGDLQDSITRSRERKKEMEQASTMLSALKQDLVILMKEQRPADERKALTEQLDQKTRDITQQKRSLQQKRNDAKYELEAISNNGMTLENRIHNMENVEKRKLQDMSNKFADVYNATMWLKDNRHMFKGHIYDPIMLELRLEKQENAKYLENTIQIRDFLSFGCENVDDMEVFVREMRVKHKLSVNAYHADGGNQLQYQSTFPIEQMRGFGFFTYLIDVIKGPAPVLNFLCKTYRIQDVPICDESTGMKIENLPKEIRVFYTREYFNHHILKKI